jgi:FkbH-like protein
MILRRSRFIHQVPVGMSRFLIVHAIRHMRLSVDRETSLLIEYFAEPRPIPEDCEAIGKLIPYSRDVIVRSVAGLVERNILTEETPEQELASVGAELSSTHGRDPSEMLERYRREVKEGAESYWAAGPAYNVADFGTSGKRADVLLFGDCDIQMEADFLRKEAAQRGIDLRVSATFPDDVRFAAEHRHDAIFIGALRARHFMTGEAAAGRHAHDGYIAQARHLLEQLREKTSAPIMIDNLPEPTVQPLGLAERGIKGHRARFRLTNVALEEIAGIMPDVHVVDIAAALGAAGSERMLDDGLVGFTHFGSPGWMLQRPENEKAAVHGIFPDTALLAQWVGGDPYLRETALARTHIDALMTVLGIGRKKCVIVDLDGTLWPGVLAETGSPFAWAPEISGTFSYVGLYFGLHEALLCLKKRGIVLACVSKNEEATVRELWKYPDNYPLDRLLTPDDFVTWRVNWSDKVDNIRGIAEELGFALDTFLFIDDHPIERDRVRQRLPEVEVWGENPFSLRRMLLSDPRLQLPVITEESAMRTTLMKTQLERQHFRAETLDECQYLASLQIQCRFERLTNDSRLARIEELFQRTTQFNTTGRKFPVSELGTLLSNPAANLFSLYVSDRFGDHGLTGAAVIVDGDILGLVISCRVLGMGIEHKFLQHILAEAQETLTGLIIETPRNIPVRNVYRDNGFDQVEPGRWRRLATNQKGHAGRMGRDSVLGPDPILTGSV